MQEIKRYFIREQGSDYICGTFTLDEIRSKIRAGVAGSDWEAIVGMCQTRGELKRSTSWVPLSVLLGGPSSSPPPRDTPKPPPKQEDTAPASWGAWDIGFSWGAFFSAFFTGLLFLSYHFVRALEHNKEDLFMFFVALVPMAAIAWGFFQGSFTWHTPEFTAEQSESSPKPSKPDSFRAISPEGKAFIYYSVAQLQSAYEKGFIASDWKVQRNEEAETRPVADVLARFSKPETKVEPSAPPNGGPAPPPGNSGAGEGPPSVS